MKTMVAPANDSISMMELTTVAAWKLTMLTGSFVRFRTNKALDAKLNRSGSSYNGKFLKIVNVSAKMDGTTELTLEGNGEQLSMVHADDDEVQVITIVN